MKLCHKMKVYKRGSNGDSRPEIRLLGKWLDKLGFGIGQEICVSIDENNRILIEKNYEHEAENFVDVQKFFEDEAKKIRKEAMPEKSILQWVREKGGIKTDTLAIDTRALSQKELGKGRKTLLRKNGLDMDVLRDEAEWEGLITPGTSTDDFKDMIETLQGRDLDASEIRRISRIREGKRQARNLRDLLQAVPA